MILASCMKHQNVPGIQMAPIIISPKLYKTIVITVGVYISLFTGIAQWDVPENLVEIAILW